MRLSTDGRNLMDDQEAATIVTNRISEVIEELMDLIRPQGVCGNPACENDPHECPEGPWMTSGWVLAIDIAAEGEGGEVETWTVPFASRGIPTSQTIGLGTKIVKWFGG